MKVSIGIVRVFLLLSLLWPGGLLAQGTAMLLSLEGPIGPASADYLERNLQRAADEGFNLVILRMDTPGGLDTSMRSMIREILASPVPVASFVAPNGARAASAGTYILYASHVAAMAPATNLGAATPVQIGGAPFPGGGEGDDEEPARDDQTNEEAPADQDQTGGDQGEEDDIHTDRAPVPGSAMERKVVNDARAYLRSLAQLRGRNVDWAERAVRDGASLSAQEAAEREVIDFVASSVADLLDQAHGMSVEVNGLTQVLDTQDLLVEAVEPDWRNRLLSVITHPQVAYILMILGIYGLFFEFSNPGALVPGVLGGIALLLALFAFQVLPINYAGLALLVLGIGFMIAEAFVPSFGVLGLGGIAAFLAGSLMLWDEQGVGYEIPLALVLGVTVFSALVFIGISVMLLRLRRRSVPDSIGLYGVEAVVREDFTGEGWVCIGPESWKARCPHPLKGGDRVRVVAREGLILDVEPLPATLVNLQKEVPHG